MFSDIKEISDGTNYRRAKVFRRKTRLWRCCWIRLFFSDVDKQQKHLLITTNKSDKPPEQRHSMKAEADYFGVFQYGWMHLVVIVISVAGGFAVCKYALPKIVSRGQMDLIVAVSAWQMCRSQQWRRIHTGYPAACVGPGRVLWRGSYDATGVDENRGISYVTYCTLTMTVLLTIILILLQWCMRVKDNHIVSEIFNKYNCGSYLCFPP